MPAQVHPAGRLRSGTLVNALLHHVGGAAVEQGSRSSSHAATSTGTQQADDHQLAEAVEQQAEDVEEVEAGEVAGHLCVGNGAEPEPEPEEEPQPLPLPRSSQVGGPARCGHPSSPDAGGGAGAGAEYGGRGASVQPQQVPGLSSLRIGEAEWVRVRPYACVRACSSCVLTLEVALIHWPSLAMDWTRKRLYCCSADLHPSRQSS